MKDGHYILGGKSGREAIQVDLMTWAKWYARQEDGTMEHRRVAAETIKEPNRFLWALGIRPDYWVSTVFLGLDHNWSQKGPPHIFETMVFKKWPRWKSWISALRWPRRIEKGGIFSQDRERFLPPRTGWVLEINWLGFYKLVPIPNPYSQLVRWFRYRYHTIFPLVPYSWNWSEHSEQDMDRYSTWDEAYTGHRKMCAKWASRKVRKEGVEA